MMSNRKIATKKQSKNSMMSNDYKSVNIDKIGDAVEDDRKIHEVKCINHFLDTKIFTQGHYMN